MNAQTLQRCLSVLAASGLAACALTAPDGRRAPVMEYGANRQPTAIVQPAPQKPQPVMNTEYETVKRIYVVQKGDTLYSISFLNGLDYRDVAEWNHLANPAAIRIGQPLELRIAVVAVPRTGPQPVMASQAAPTTQSASEAETKSYPRVGRLRYSEQALAEAERQQNGAAASAVPAAKAGAAAVRTADDEAPLQWGMPTSGKIVAGFSESENRKGIDIAGQRGQAVLASAAGRVVYSGSGLRGYGKLIIIKHNKTYLSAYAHNDRILVKEGQSVSKGQKIAEMGSTDAPQVGLHFEIRKLGKPVDPALYLSPARS